MNSKLRFQAACRNESVDRPPVWIMRQAGRTLPEYRALKEKYTFWELCRSPELATQVTLQPLRRFPLDAAIIFSDILVIPDAMGVGVNYTPSPVLSPMISSRSELDSLVSRDVGVALKYVADAIRSVSSEIGNEKALLGFSGAPYTLACYMIDGIGGEGFPRTRAMMFRDPGLLKALLERLAEMVGDYLEMQIEASIDGFQLFDTWACDLSEAEFREFALPYANRIFERLAGKGVPSIYYINGIGNLLEAAAEAGSALMGIDWRISLAEVRRRLGDNQVVQGNLDPFTLHGSAELIRARVFDMLDQTGGRGHVVNLGHGLSPGIPLAGIEAFVNSVYQWAEAGHGTR